MKISISNIAWNKEDDDVVYEIMQSYGLYGLDVAPARVFNHPFEITEAEGQTFIDEIKEKGLVPVGMQSLLYGTSGLQLFGTKDEVETTICHLKKIMDYAAKIGISRLVFGSPKNRLVGHLTQDQIVEKATYIFNKLGDYAQEKGMYFCIEPNPMLYGADYITSTRQGIELVKKIDNKGFRLHLDLGTMLVNDEDVEEVVREAIPVTEHVHLSHPNLEPVIGNEDKHILFRDALIKHQYKGVVAIEMKNSMEPNNIEVIRESIEFIASIYGGMSNE